MVGEVMRFGTAGNIPRPASPPVPGPVLPFWPLVVGEGASGDDKWSAFNSKAFTLSLIIGTINK